MNVIEMVNDIAKNLIEFSEEIKSSRESLTSDQIDGILEETNVQVLDECKKKLQILLSMFLTVNQN